MAIQGQDITYNINQLQDLLDKVNNLGDATTETAGLMSAEDKQKVDNAITQETDPTVPSWAKASDKPSYSASEVGAVPTTRKVNNKALSADVTLSASDVGALPSDTELFSGSYDDLTDKPTIPAEQIQSDWNQSNTSAKDYIKNKPTIPDISNCITKSSTSGLVKNDGSIDTNTYLTQHQDISNYVQKSNTTGLLKNDGSVDTNTYLTSAPVTSVNGQTGAVSLSIPTESTVSGWGFTKNAGTITGVTMNGASKGTSGVVDLGTVITAHQDISGKADKSEMGVSTSGDQTTITLKSGTSATVINQHQSLSGYVQTSNTAGLIKNDGTIDTTSYGTYSKPAGGIPASDIASGVIPTVPSNIVTGSSQSYTIWSGTQAQYDALATKDNNTIYLIKES